MTPLAALRGLLRPTSVISSAGTRPSFPLGAILALERGGNLSLLLRVAATTAARRGFASDAKPEPVRLRLPDGSSTELNRSIREWFKKEGEVVEMGDALCEVDAGDVVYDFTAPVKGHLVRITARKGAKDLKAGEIIGYMATSLDNLTSVAYEAAKEIAEGRVQEHLGDDQPMPSETPSAVTIPTGLGGSAASNGNATTTTADDRVLTKWLRDISQNDEEYVREYADKFKREGFTTLDSIAKLDESDLNAMDITKRGHRKIILQAARDLANSRKPNAASSSSSS